MPGQSIIISIRHNQFYEWRSACAFLLVNITSRRETVVCWRSAVKFLFFFRFSFLTNTYTEVHCSGGDVLMASCVYISDTDNCKNKKKGKRRILSTLRRYITEFSGSR